MWKSSALPPAADMRTSTMGDGKGHWRAPSATPWDDMCDDDLTGAQRIVKNSQKSIYGFRHTPDPRDADFFNYYVPDACPACGGAPVKNGRRASGVQRYVCKDCGLSFTSATGTIFDNAKLPVAAWADFILQALSFASISSMTREDRRSDTTAPYWMEKLFFVLEGIQDGACAAGKVWADETYWPVAAKDAVGRADGHYPRGLSRNQLCIAAATDKKATVMISAGRGKPSRKRIWNALGPHIAKGSVLYHDMERSHDVLVDRLGLVSRRYNAALLKGMSDDLNPLEPIDRVCFFIKAMLRSHPGFDRERLQGYLDLLYVALNPPNDKLEKVAMVLERAMHCPKTLRFRTFYGKDPS